jgi:hypothetical protein
MPLTKVSWRTIDVVRGPVVPGRLARNVEGQNLAMALRLQRPPVTFGDNFVTDVQNGQENKSRAVAFCRFPSVKSIPAMQEWQGRRAAG